MKTHTRRYWLLLAAICTAGGAGSTPRVGRPIPSATSLLQRALSAHRELGPCFVRESTVYKHAGKIARPRVDLYQYGDRSHFVHSPVGRSGWSQFANGAVMVMYDASKRVYAKDRVNAYDQLWCLGLLSSKLGIMEATFNTPEFRSVLAGARVSLATISGVHVYRIVLPPGKVKEHNLRISALDVRQVDYLVSGLTERNDYGDEETVTATYDNRSLPRSTFVFAPPPGTRQIPPPR